jgi:hypothetical protein
MSSGRIGQFVDVGTKGRRDQGTEGPRDGGRKGRRCAATELRRDGGTKGRAQTPFAKQANPNRAAPVTKRTVPTPTEPRPSGSGPQQRRALRLGDLHGARLRAGKSRLVTCLGDSAKELRFTGYESRRGTGGWARNGRCLESSLPILLTADPAAAYPTTARSWCIRSSRRSALDAMLERRPRGRCWRVNRSP